MTSPCHEPRSPSSSAAAPAPACGRCPGRCTRSSCCRWSATARSCRTRCARLAGLDGGRAAGGRLQRGPPFPGGRAACAEARAPPALILEPEGRNTAPAVAVAALVARRQAGGDVLLLVLPADHVIRDSRPSATRSRWRAPAAEAGQLVTFGVVPTQPGDRLRLHPTDAARATSVRRAARPRVRREARLRDGRSAT